jgi:CRISPR-associated protein Cas1
MERILDVEKANLTVRVGALIVKKDGKKDVVIAAEEIAVVVVTTSVALSAAVLTLLAKAGACLISLDDKFLPASMTVPLIGHSRATERLQLQIERQPRIAAEEWRKIVVRKIEAQAAHLYDNFKREQANSLRNLGFSILPGDPKNIEGQAARIYWQTLFGNDFSRRDDDDEANWLLNYGYAVLRAMVVRAIVAKGLHPGIGLHHRNTYDPFPLGADLMEPFRPTVDRVALKYLHEEMTPATKRAVLEDLMELREPIYAEAHRLFSAINAA